MADGKKSTVVQSPQEKLLTEEAKLAVLRKKIAEGREAEAKAEKQITDAQKAAQDLERESWKGPDIKAPDGKITATGNFVETKLLANKCLLELVNELVRKLKGSEAIKGDEKILVLYNAADLPAIQMYASVNAQIRGLQNLLSEQIKVGNIALMDSEKSDTEGGSAFVLGLASSGILKSAADVFSFFKTNTTISNHELTTDDNILVACLAEALQSIEPKIKLFHPGVFPIKPIYEEDSASPLITMFTNLKGIKNHAVSLLEKINVKLMSIENDLLVVAIPQDKQRLETVKARLNEVSFPLKAAIELFAQTENNLLGVDQSTKVSMLSSILQAEQLVELLKSGNSYVIKINASLSGSSRQRDGLFRKTTLSHSGGAQLSCLVFASDGSTCFSFNSFRYIAEQESKAINEMLQKNL